MEKAHKQWISVAEYAKRKGVKSPQVIYNWIAMGKLKQGKDYRIVEKKIQRKEMFFEE